MTDTPLSKTAALKAAQAACGSIYRRSSTDYVCLVPYYDTKPRGPSTELQASDYWRCRAARTRRVATIALALMGARYEPRGRWRRMGGRARHQLLLGDDRTRHR